MHRGGNRFRPVSSHYRSPSGAVRFRQRRSTLLSRGRDSALLSSVRLQGDYRSCRRHRLLLVVLPAAARSAAVAASRNWCFGHEIRHHASHHWPRGRGREERRPEAYNNAAKS
ncbi:hypothetical protein U9M48_037899 [Paspalum notatum var. saurae]|uniref:Uncharacterized protein n=1 Tax=Paspalum notatum var. saurae TaxID=547442 RepID=A0AAQ3UFX1_PASNO